MVSAAKFSRAERELKVAKPYGIGAQGNTLLCIHNDYCDRIERFLVICNVFFILWQRIKAAVSILEHPKNLCSMLKYFLK